MISSCLFLLPSLLLLQELPLSMALPQSTALPLSTIQLDIRDTHVYSFGGDPQPFVVPVHDRNTKLPYPAYIPEDLKALEIDYNPQAACNKNVQGYPITCEIRFGSDEFHTLVITGTGAQWANNYFTTQESIITGIDCVYGTA